MADRIPAVLGHSQRFYDMMVEESEPYPEGGMLYTGFLTKTFEKTGLAIPAYTKCLKLMQQMGCVTQIKRGARGKQSVWHLRERPTRSLMADIDPSLLDGANQIVEQIKEVDAITQSQIRSLTRRVSSLEGLTNDLREVVNQLKLQLEAATKPKATRQRKSQ